VDTDRPDDTQNGDAYEPVEVDTSIDETSVGAPVVTTAPPASRLLLATVAALAVAAVGVAAWAGLFLATNKEFPGVTVVFGLLIGYVVSRVSRRGDVVAGIVAALVTAVLCLVGNVAAISAGVVNQYKLSFLDIFKDLLPDAFSLLTDRPALTLLIFAVAVAVAFGSTLSSSPKASAGDVPSVYST